MEQKYFKVTEVAKIYGMRPVMVRSFCHAKGQQFAFRPIPNGCFYIDLKKFEEFLARRTAK